MASNNVEFYERLKSLQDSVFQCEQKSGQLENQLESYYHSDRRLAKLRAIKLKYQLQKLNDDEKKTQIRNDKYLQDRKKQDRQIIILGGDKSTELRRLKTNYETYIERVFPMWRRQLNIDDRQNDTSQPRAQKQPVTIAAAATAEVASDPYAPKLQGFGSKYQAMQQLIQSPHIRQQQQQPTQNIEKGSKQLSVPGGGGQKIPHLDLTMSPIQESRPSFSSEISQDDESDNELNDNKTKPLTSTADIRDLQSAYQAALEKPTSSETIFNSTIPTVKSKISAPSSNKTPQDEIKFQENDGDLLSPELISETIEADVYIPDEKCRATPPVTPRSSVVTPLSTDDTNKKGKVLAPGKDPVLIEDFIDGSQADDNSLNLSFKISAEIFEKKKSHKLAKALSPRHGPVGKTAASPSSAVSPRSGTVILSVDGLDTLLDYIETKVQETLNPEGLYRQDCSFNTILALTRKVNKGTDISTEAVSTCCDTVLCQLPYMMNIIKPEQCLLTGNMLSKKLGQITVDKIRSGIPTKCLMVWDRLMSHFKLLLHYNVMSGQSLAELFGPLLIKEGSKNQAKAISIMSALFQAASLHDDMGSDDTSSVSIPSSLASPSHIKSHHSHKPTVNTTITHPEQHSKPPTQLQNVPEDSDENDQSSESDVPHVSSVKLESSKDNGLSAYQQMLSSIGGLKRQKSAGENSLMTESDIESELAAAVSSKPASQTRRTVGDKTTASESLSESSSKSRNNATPHQQTPRSKADKSSIINQLEGSTKKPTARQKIPGLWGGSDIESESDIETGLKNQTQNDDIDDFDFYD